MLAAWRPLQLCTYQFKGCGWPIRPLTLAIFADPGWPFMSHLALISLVKRLQVANDEQYGVGIYLQPSPRASRRLVSCTNASCDHCSESSCVHGQH